MEFANLSEVFGSIQGEGLLVGVSQIFIRFSGCNLRCKYCDTRYAQELEPEYKWEVKRGICKSGKNPISISQLIEILKGFDLDYYSITLTGGEPLLQADFILDFFSLLPSPYSLLPVYLETNATLPSELKKIIHHLDIIAIDIKLPSSTGEAEYWKEHRESLKIAQERKVFTKTVITNRTSLEDVKMAISLIEEITPEIPLILQPASDIPPSNEVLFNYQREASLSLKEVRIIPQIHKLMGLR